MNAQAEMTDARRLLRALETGLHAAISGSYQWRDAAWFREQAAHARAVADQAEAVAALMERAP